MFVAPKGQISFQEELLSDSIAVEPSIPPLHLEHKNTAVQCVRGMLLCQALHRAHFHHTVKDGADTQTSPS